MSKRVKGILVELRERAQHHRATSPDGDTADLLDRAAHAIERLNNLARERLLRAREAEGRKPPKKYREEGGRWARAAAPTCEDRPTFRGGPGLQYNVCTRCGKGLAKHAGGLYCPAAPTEPVLPDLDPGQQGVS